MKAIHILCGHVIPDVTIKIEKQVEGIELFGTIPTISIPPTVTIMDVPHYCPICCRKLYTKDISII